jgi:hypothetical protein
VGDRGAAPTVAAAALIWRSASHDPGPQLFCGDRVHGPHIHAVAAAARAGARLWFPGHVLAPADRMGQGRRVRSAPRRGARPTRCRRRAGVVAGERRHHERARQTWGDHVAANPVDRGKPGSKLHLVCDGSGLPLTVAVTAANVNDSTMFEALMDDVPAVRTPHGLAEDVPQLLRQVRSATRRSARTHCTSSASRSSTRAPGTGDRPRLVGRLVVRVASAMGGCRS